MESFNTPKNTGKRAKARPFVRSQFPIRGFLFSAGFGFQFLCVFLLIFANDSAFSCPAYVFQNGKFVEAMSGGEVFIRFAKTHIGERYAEVLNSRMSLRHRSGWKASIRSRTRRWSPQQAEEFLNIFTDRLGAHGALLLTARSLSHLENLIPAQTLSTEPAFQNITNRIAYYDNYMGEEKTTQRLFNSSLDGFIDRDIDKTRELTRFLESYYGSKKIVVQIMERNLGDYSKTGREDIEPIMLFLDKHIGRPALIEITLRDKRKKKGYLSIGKLKNLQKTVWPLIDDGVIPSSPESDQIIKEGLLALIERQADDLAGSRKMAEFLMSHFGEGLVAEIMNEDLKVFALVPGGMNFREERVMIFDKHFKDRRQAAEFIKIHRKKLFSDSRWEQFVEKNARFFPEPPWRNTWN